MTETPVTDDEQLARSIRQELETPLRKASQIIQAATAKGLDVTFSINLDAGGRWTPSVKIVRVLWK